MPSELTDDPMDAHINPLLYFSDAGTYSFEGNYIYSTISLWTLGMHATIAAKHPEGFNMADIKVGNGSISILSLIAMVGALLAFIGFFLAIAKYETTAWGIK